MQAANFGDKRLSNRLVLLTGSLAAKPTQSLPEAAGGDAELEATYRFSNNERVTPERILAPHFAATALCAAKEGATLVLHDTSTFEFPAHRLGMGYLDRRRHGFQGRSCGFRPSTRLSSSRWSRWKRKNRSSPREALEVLQGPDGAEAHHREAPPPARAGWSGLQPKTPGAMGLRTLQLALQVRAGLRLPPGAVHRPGRRR